MKYKDYEIEDFVNDDFFVAWVLNPTKENQDYWAVFLKENPEKEETIEQAASLVMDIFQAEKKYTDEVASVTQTVWEKVRQYVEDDKVVVPLVRWPAWWKYAAAVFLIVTSGVILWLQLQEKETSLYQSRVKTYKDNSLAEVINTTEKSVQVVFSDGSTAALSPGSRLSYDKHFRGKTRDIFLQGQAFFEVEKNPSKPFHVYANELVVSVLGTSFRVDATEKAVVVAVKTGRVSVSTTDENLAKIPQMLLTPNQQISFDRAETHMKKSIVAQPEKVVTESLQYSFVYRQTPLTEVFTELEKTYGIPFVYDKEQLKNCTLTANLKGESLHKQLALIAKVLSLSYEEIDGQIVIVAGGCPEIK